MYISYLVGKQCNFTEKCNSIACKHGKDKSNCAELTHVVQISSIKKMAALSSLGKFKNTGLLLIRIGLGILFILHGYPKLLGGPDLWTGVGSAMGNIGITFLPVFWGLLAALAETVGGACLLLGLFFRPAAIVLAFTMLIAALSHLDRGDGLTGASHAIEIGVVFIGLAFVGPGKYSADKR